jgi:hypothetical protein
MPFSEDGAERTAAPSARRREASARRFRLQLENVVQAQPERQRRNNSMRSRTIAAIAALAALRRHCS